MTNGLISWGSAYTIATNASKAARSLVEKLASASTTDEITKYGFRGVLYHYYVWNDGDSDFLGKAGAEITSVDTVLLMFGLMVSAQFFGGQALADYEAARDAIDRKSWLDSATVGHENQFRLMPSSLYITTSEKHRTSAGCSSRCR